MHRHRAWAWMIVALAYAGCDDGDTADDHTQQDTSAGRSAGASAVAGKGGTAGAGGRKGAAGKGAAGSTGYEGTADAGAEGDGSDAGVSADTDYSEAEAWLCRPGHNQACAVDLTSTAIDAAGDLTKEPFEANPTPPIDCFYVYPTVSRDTTPNSDLVPGDEERAVVRAQFARFASQCRVFAPLYRQVTLTALSAQLAGMPLAADREVGYRDVLAAWHYYLEHDNAGRGVVLIGHSQGSGVLTQLVKAELDTEPRDERFISALLTGTNVLVPKDKLVGGTFKHVPLCSAKDELGCVVVYASFRANAPPTDTSLFARSTEPGLVAACTNPAALGGGNAALDAYLSTEGPGTSSNVMPAWVTGGEPVTTPFVRVPGLLSAECLATSSGSYLAITVNSDTKDPRADDIVGDVITNGMLQANWGLHLIDMHLAMGNLLDMVHAQAGAYTSK